MIICVDSVAWAFRNQPRRECDRCNFMFTRLPIRATLWGKDYCVECEPIIRAQYINE